jgi:hypothetical protein
MPVDIYIDAKQQREFKRRAVAAFHKNQEYMEAVFIRRSVGEFSIVKFIKLKLKGAKPGFIDCDDAHFAALKIEATQQGLEFGTVHTHLWGDSALSEWDHKEAVKEKETLTGVCFIEKDAKTKRVKTRLEFWQPQLPGKLKVIHSK